MVDGVVEGGGDQHSVTFQRERLQFALESNAH